MQSQIDLEPKVKESPCVEYVAPTLVPLFSTDEDQPDGLIEANGVNFVVASSLSYTT